MDTNNFCWRRQVGWDAVYSSVNHMFLKTQIPLGESEFCQTSPLVFWAKLVNMMYWGQNLRKHIKEVGSSTPQQWICPSYHYLNALWALLQFLLIYPFLGMWSKGEALCFRYTKEKQVIWILFLDLDNFALLYLFETWQSKQSSPLQRLHLLRRELLRVVCFFLKLCFSVSSQEQKALYCIPFLELK